MNKKKRQAAFSYSWPLYIVLPVISGLAISYLFYATHRPAYYETVDLFVASSEIKRDELVSRLKSKLQDKGLKEATITFSNPSDSVFAQKLSVVGYNGSDLFLLPKSVLEGMSCIDILLPFNTAFVSKYTSSVTSYFEQKDAKFGIYLDKNDEFWKGSGISFVNEDYYLCINGTSKNIGSEGLYDNPEYDLALETFLLLEHESL